ncbi:TonB-dependent receptor [Haloflavibacter putidus]|uniref:TonB-dependent receptor n=1 Tax=Haloflavibacter putidus TaxID=2576776 RepID=A0A507ZS58_9FLAO|nr:TonB-dependent receptor [Haloflavibacter putidus]TQD37675.1 TonB-dependent receptor [Haloflavibacter putidus]
MRYFLLYLVLFGTIQFSFAQQKTNPVSINFNNVTVKEAISQLENKTDLNFFYDQNWLEEQDVKIQKYYNNASLHLVLEELLEETNINFLIYNQSVILSKNNFIYKDLPRNFFGKDSLNTQNRIVNQPVFYQEFQTATTARDTTATQEKPLAFIGKENKEKTNEVYKITGVVKAAKTGNPIPFIAVSTVDQSKSVATDANGFYSIKLPVGANELQVSSLEYQKQTRKIMVYSDGSLDFSMLRDVNLLDEVVISGEKKRNIRAAVTGVSSIKMEEVKTVPLVLGERDVIKIATTLPGISNVGEGSQGFNVRGGKTDQNLVLLNEGVIYNPFHFFGFFSAVNPYLVDKADLYKGSIPPEYGGRLSSVFDIQTKKPNLKNFSGEGGIGPVTGNLTASVPIIKDKAGISVGGRATYADWILNALDNEDLKNSEASFYDAFIKYYHKLDEDNSIEANAYYSRDKFSITSDSLNTYDNLMLNLKWEHDFNNDHRASLFVNNSNYGFDINYESRGTNNFDFGYNINETQVKAKFDYNYNSKHTITYGVTGKLYNIKPGEIKPSGPTSVIEPLKIDEEKGLETAVFIGDAFKISDKLLLNAGLRYSFYSALGPGTQNVYEPGLPLSELTQIGVETYDDNETIETYGGLEYRFSARYFLLDDFSVKAGFDTNNQYIHLLSTNTTQSPTDTWKLSNLNIEPQKSKQYSLGFFKNFASDMYEVSLEGYYKTMENMLDYKTGAEVLLNENLETELLQGEGKAYGVEFLIKKTSGKFNGWLGYTYSRSKIKLDGAYQEQRVNNGNFFPTNYDKPHDFSLVLNYKLTKRFSFSANAVYQTGRPITYPVGKFQYGNIEYVTYSDRNAFRIPDYYRLDLGVNIEANHRKGKLAHGFWNISVYNVLGRNNPYNIYFVTEDGKVKGYKSSIFSIPIPTVTYNFKF